MQPATQSDDQVVDKSRRIVAAQGRIRWVMLVYAAVFLGMCGYCTVAGIRKIENLDTEQLKGGFVFGLALAVVWTSFGIMGGLCLGKFLAGFRSDFRFHELLVRYHDRLRDLGQLPDERSGESDGAANGSQLSRSEGNRTSGAAASHTHPERLP
jgi:hypothetical protein